MRTLAIVNQKGGSGKTTTAINLAAVYARRGLRTLLVDMDPQSHCAVGLGVPERQLDKSIADALVANHEKFDFDSLLWEVNSNLHLAPSTMRLATLEAPGGGLHELPDKDRRLESALNKLAPRFDRCVIDCPPTIGLLTFNGLRACRETLIPVETGFFALRGAEKQWQTIQRLIAHINRPIACHMLATLHNPNSSLARDILGALQREFAGQIMPVVIEEHEELREAASFGQPIVEFAPQSEARRQFEALADWLEAHIAAPVVQIETLVSEAHMRAALAPSHTAAAGASPAAASPGASVSPIRGVSAVVDTRHSERAAELVRRVQSLTRSEGGPHQPPSPPPPQPLSTSAVTAVAPPPLSTRPGAVPSIGPERRVVEIEVEPRLGKPPQPAASPAHSAASSPATLQPPGETSPSAAVSIPPPREDVVSESIRLAILEIREEIRSGAGAAGAAAPRAVWPPAMPLTLPRPRLGQVCVEISGRTPQRVHATASSRQYGVRVESGFVVFTQPAGIGRTVAIAGDFNRWSPRANAFHLVEGGGHIELRLSLPPGRHQYRLVIDGRWQADPYNDLQQRNAHGEPNSVVVVPTTHAASPMSHGHPPALARELDAFP